MSDASLRYGVHPLNMNFSVVQSPFTSLEKGEVCIIDLNLKNTVVFAMATTGAMF